MVDLGSGAAAKARSGEIVFKPPGQISNQNSRNQRGEDLFATIFADLKLAADSLTREDKKPHPIVLVDLASWTGDSVAAFWA